MENLPERGFGATCCACVSFAWEIVRDSPMVNFVSQKMNPEGVLPYMGYIGMCRCEGYGFQAVYFRIGYINQSVWSRIGHHFSGN